VVLTISGLTTEKDIYHRGQVWNDLVNLRARVRVPSRTSFNLVFQNNKVKPIANPAVKGVTESKSSLTETILPCS